MEWIFTAEKIFGKIDEIPRISAKNLDFKPFRQQWIFAGKIHSGSSIKERKKIYGIIFSGMAVYLRILQDSR